MATYNIFISHSWSYGDEYEKLKRLLDAAPYFSYKDYSIPKDDPVHNAASKWIDQEIRIAKRGFPLPKPILAIEPWALKKRHKL